jgi:hypothetical protein
MGFDHRGLLQPEEGVEKVRSKLRSKLPIVLSVTALVIAVMGATGTAIAHGVPHALFAHNAGKVNGWKANQLIRSAHTSFDSAVPVTGTVEVMSTTINAPKKGFVLVNASVVYTGSGGEVVHCGVELDDVNNWTGSDANGQSVEFSTGDSFLPCAAMTRFAVTKGVHELSFDTHNDGVGSLSARGGSLTVLYEPFGKGGKTGAPARPVLRSTHDINK